MILCADTWEEKLGWIYANQERKGQITCDIQTMQTGLISWLAAGRVIASHAAANGLLDKKQNLKKKTRTPECQILREMLHGE